MKTAPISLLFLLSFMFTAAPSEPVKAIVFPLENTIKVNTLAWLGEGIALSVSRQLRGRNVRVIERQERNDLVESMDLPPGAQISRASMIRVAQRASVDLVVLGEISGTEQSLKVTVRVLDMRTMKLSGDMAANGSLAGLPQMENSLAWLILSNTGLEKTFSREKFEEKARRVPNRPYAHYVQSLSLSDEDERIQLLRTAVALFHDFPEAQFQLGYLYYRREDCRSAMPHLMVAHSGGSTQLENEFMSGTCYLQEDRPAQAIQSLSRVLAFFRSHEVLNNLGVAYLRKGDYTQSLNSLLEARDLSRTDPTVALNLAIVRHIQGNDTAARSGLEDAIRTNSRNGMLQFLYSAALRALGENDKAAAAANKARALGISVENLLAEDPKKWARVLANWDRSKTP